MQESADACICNMSFRVNESCIYKGDNLRATTVQTSLFYGLFQLVGAGILGLGIYALGSHYGARELSSVLGNDLYQVAAYVLIGTGVTLVIISICGCCGAHRESKCMLGVVSIDN